MWTVARIIKGMKLSKRFSQKMKYFHNLFDGQKNWKNYREAIAKDKESGSVLPHLGLRKPKFQFRKYLIFFLLKNS